MDTTNVFYQYQYGVTFGYQQFKQFQTSHLGAIIVSILLIIFIPLFAKKYLSPKGQDILGKTIGWIIFSNVFIWMGIEIAAGTFEWGKHLPLQLCRFSNVLIPLVMTYRKEKYFDVLYCWAFSGILQATITPDLQHEFPHFMFFRYFIGHPAVILAIVYAISVYGMKPSKKTISNGMIGLNIFFVSVAIINIVLGSNYFFLCAKPLTRSVLDSFGPWPWYLVVCEVLFLVNFTLSYLPFWDWKKGIEKMKTIMRLS
jgi:hypothetical integral membrane protein (TIGR02206 family)